jgi:hypothetical protein
MQMRPLLDYLRRRQYMSLRRSRAQSFAPRRRCRDALPAALVAIQEAKCVVVRRALGSDTFFAGWM